MLIRYYFSPLPLQLFLRFLIRPFLKFFLRMEICGLENLKNLKGSFIIASNHIHEFDVVLLPSAIPLGYFRRPFFFVSLPKKEYQDSWRGKIFYGGFIFFLLGGLRAYRGKNDYHISLSNHIKVLNKGEVVYIFPEGMVSRGGEPSEARGGLAFLAYESKIPVLPIKIEGVFGMGLRDFLLRKRTLTIRIGKPIENKEIFNNFFEANSDNFKKASQIILNRILEINSFT